MGYGFNDPNGFARHALLWAGSAESAVDLGQLLPALRSDSTAFGIDDHGIVWGIAYDLSGSVHAVEWSPVPEPASFLFAALGLIAFVFLRWNRMFAACAAIFLIGISAASVAAQSYAGTDLYVVNVPRAEVLDISPSGETVGYVWGGPNVQPMSHALLWAYPDGNLTDLTPFNLAGFNSAQAIGTDGTQQVGSGGFAPSIAGGGGFRHALLWSGTAVSAVDLHPTNLSGFAASTAYGVAGGQQVGAEDDGTGNGISHALLWSGTAASAIDLNPTNLIGIESSVAYGTDGSRQIGSGVGSGTGGHTHALLWNGTAATTVDLHPYNLPNLVQSTGYGVSGNQQVGVGYDAIGNRRALVWNGTASSAVDLHPTNLVGFLETTAFDTNGAVQVGDGTNSISNNLRALLWRGTPDSAVDLSELLPFSATLSTAYTVDSQGNVFGIAYDSDLVLHAVEWSPVPEASGCVLAGVGLPMMIALACCKRGAGDPRIAAINRQDACALHAAPRALR